MHHIHCNINLNECIDTHPLTTTHFYVLVACKKVDVLDFWNLNKFTRSRKKKRRDFLSNESDQQQRKKKCEKERMKIQILLCKYCEYECINDNNKEKEISCKNEMKWISKFLNIYLKLAISIALIGHLINSRNWFIICNFPTFNFLFAWNTNNLVWWLIGRCRFDCCYRFYSWIDIIFRSQCTFCFVHAIQRFKFFPFSRLYCCRFISACRNVGHCKWHK